MFVYSRELGNTFGIFKYIRLEEAAVCFCSLWILTCALRMELEGCLVTLEGLFNLHVWLGHT